MRATLAAYGDQTRTVWLADSFEGVPPPDAAKYKADKGDRLHRYAALAVPEEEVRANFQRYDLLDGQVRFIPGWFKDTLHKAPIEQIAVLRLDGDLYESTIQALDALYPRLSPAASASSTTITRLRHARRPSRITVSNIRSRRRSSK